MATRSGPIQKMAVPPNTPNHKKLRREPNLEGRGGGKGNPGVLVLQGHELKNFRFRAKIRFPEEGCSAIEIRRSGTGQNSNGYFVSAGGSGAALPIPPVGSVAKANDYQYGKTNGWKLQSESTSFALNTWKIVDITILGNRIVTEVDGMKVSEYVDLGEPFKSGTITLVCGGTSVVQFQEVMIQELPD